MGDWGSCASTSDMGMIGAGNSPPDGVDAEDSVLEGVNVSGVNTTPWNKLMEFVRSVWART